MARQFHKDGAPLPDGDDWVFVYGSNLEGRHGAGAAKAARTLYGARHGVASGLRGRSYGIPTKGTAFIKANGRTDFRQLTAEQIRLHVQTFLADARAMPSKRFMVTRIGCGLAGWPDEAIAPMFRDAPPNCSFADEWRPWVVSERESEAT